MDVTPLYKAAPKNEVCFESFSKTTEQQKHYIRYYRWNIDYMRRKMREDGVPIPSLIHFFNIKI